MRVVLLSLLLLFFFTGCSNEKDKAVDAEELMLKSKSVETVEFAGVYGDVESLPHFENIEYMSVELKSLSANNKNLDGLIITEESFQEADKNTYVPFYNEAAYPVFFVGIEDFKSFAFTTENMTIESSRDDNAAYIQGFSNEPKQGFDIYKENATKKEMFIRVFNFISESNF